MFDSNSTGSGIQYFAVATSVSREEVERVDFFSGVLKYQYEIVRAEMRKLNSNPLRELPPVTQVSQEVASNLVAFVESLEPIACLSDGWDGPGSYGPKVVSIWRAVIDTYALLAIAFPAPKAKILSDGRLGAYWKQRGCYATIDFEEDGIHIWTVANGKHQKTGTWNSSDKVPEALRAAGAATASERGWSPVSVDGRMLPAT